MNEEVEITLLQDEVSVETPLVADYILPTATSSTLGGVKIGDNIDIDDSGHISVPIASASGVGLVKAGTGLAISSDGTLTATGTYELPEATKNTLGGVYVDDELNTESINPVQNAVVSLALDEIDDTITGLQSTVGGLDDTVDGLSDDVESVTNDLSTLSTTVGTLSTSVGTLSTTVSTQGGLITGLSDAQTATGNALTQLQGNVDPVLSTYTEELTYQDIDDTIWSNGILNIYKRGYTGVVYSTLEGSLTIASESSEVVYTIADSDYFPLNEATGYMISDLGMIRVSLNTSGEFTVYNDNNSSITITELKGNLPVVWSNGSI